MDGWITIGTKLDSKNLEKDIKNAKSKMKQYDKEAEKLAQQKAKINLDLSAYEEEKRKIKENTDLTLKQAQTQEQASFVLEQENLELEQLNSKYSEIFKRNEDITKSITENTNQQSLLNKEIQEMNEKLNRSKGFEQVKNSINQANNSMSGVIKKVTKWGLAVFSVRSAYSFIRNSISTLSQYNSQMASDIEYIRFALANSLAPVINYIINLTKTLLAYINYIFKAWFGKDLFASAKDWEKAQKASGGIAKNTEKIKKTLQSTNFDELDILQEQEDTTANSGSTGFTAPSFDLTDFKDIEIPKWVQWIADNKDLFKVIGEGLAILFGASLLSKVTDFIEKFSTFSGILSAIPTSIMIALAVIGVVEAIEALKKVSDEAKKLDDQYKGIFETQEKLRKSQQTFNEKLKEKLANGELDIEQIKTIINLSKDSINSTKQEVDGIIEKMNTMSAWEKLTTNNYYNYQTLVEKAIEKNEEEINTLITVGESYGYNKEKLQEFGLSTDDIINKLNDQVSMYENLNSTLNENDERYKQNNDKINQLKQTIYSITRNELQDEINKLEEKNKKINSNSEEYEKNGRKIEELKKKIEDLDNTNANVEITADTSNAEKKAGNFFTNLAQSIGSVVESGVGLFSNSVKGLASKIKSLWSKHADGGIISLPGRGVQIGPRDIGGEAGTEGIIPLTKEQQMELLGESIAKHININLTNITKLGSRQIAREQKVVNAQNDFMYNR